MASESGQSGWGGGGVKGGRRRVSSIHYRRLPLNGIFVSSSFHRPFRDATLRAAVISVLRTRSRLYTRQSETPAAIQGTTRHRDLYTRYRGLNPFTPLLLTPPLPHFISFPLPALFLFLLLFPFRRGARAWTRACISRRVGDPSPHLPAHPPTRRHVSTSDEGCSGPACNVGLKTDRHVPDRGGLLIIPLRGRYVDEVTVEMSIEVPKRPPASRLPPVTGSSA